MQKETMQPVQANPVPFKIKQSHEPQPCFRRGSYIELATGVMRRVEDIRTEDFIQSAQRCQEFDLNEATVVKIDRSATHAIQITFTYDTQHSRVEMEVAPSYPLFVYGQGWASCNPQLSFALYELKCQQLQVGDICLSLVAHDPPDAGCELHNQLQAIQQRCQAAALPRYPYHMYAEMANLVAAYTQHLIGKLAN